MGRINGFFGHIKHNDLMSGLMFFGFLIAAQIMAGIILMIPLFFFDSRHSILSPLDYLGRYGPLVLIGSIVLFWVRFKSHINTVHQQLGFVYINPNENRQLVTIVETLALTAGIMTPRIGIIETYARNAFACGLTQKDAVIVVTRGLLNALTRDELEAVIAHEITHIVNDDIKLIAAANVMLTGLEFANTKNPFVMRSWWRFLFIPIFPAILIISEFIKRTSRFALDLGKVSRLVITSSREYIADAEAVRLTHKPAALISALKRIENLSTIEGMLPQNDAMMIDGASVGSFATHPTIGERIAVLQRLSGEKPTAPTPSPVLPPQHPVAQPQPSVSVNTPLSIPGLWRRFNDHMDEIDAKEEAKIAARKGNGLGKLFARVQDAPKPDKTQTLVKRLAPFIAAPIFIYLVNIVGFGATPFGRAEIAELQPNGTYMRHGVTLSQAEFKKMKRDMRYSPASIVAFAPSQLKPPAHAVAAPQNGLRGHMYRDEGDRS